ncbi:MAG: hypothetical protein MJE66_14300 [Proteobacteria bacterium]|nr:hypothetical protein [Pseudomonadota bacterium]
MTVSRRKTARSRAGRPQRLWPALLLCALAAAACRTPVPVPAGSPLEPLSVRVAPTPEAEDRLAARLAGAALVDDLERVEAALSELEAVDGGDSRNPNLLALAHDLRNATAPDDAGYRRATRALLRTRDISADPALEARLERAVADDPLRLANERVLDDYHALFARTFNAVSEPVGRSLLTGFTVAPVALASSAAHYLAQSYREDALSTRERQALVLRQRYLAEDPDGQHSERVSRQVASARAELHQTHRDRLHRQARRALRADQYERARVLANLALDFAPADPALVALVGEAEQAAAAERARLQRSLEATPGGDNEASLALARDLLTPGADLEANLRALAASEGSEAFSDEIVFVRALVESETGSEERAWQRLRGLARRSPERSNVVRHAANLVDSSQQNPYEAFREIRSRERARFARWLVFDRFADGPRYTHIPKPIAYLVDLPAVAQTLVQLPVRLLVYPFRPNLDFHVSTAAAAQRYLDRAPRGSRAEEVRTWLLDYHEERENWLAVERLLRDLRDEGGELAWEDIHTRAADQALRISLDQPRRDLQVSMLKRLSQEYYDTDAGRVAGGRVREITRTTTPQSIRITAQYLRENPRLAGPDGLGLRPSLIDGQTENGELHPDGVTLAGGRVLEFAFLAESGDEADAPTRLPRRVSSERLARVVSLLEETALRNERVDRDDKQAANAPRDLYLERARLGLTDRVDTRPTARSTYTYQGVRERYGMVRSRESVLPFDLVVQGSLRDLSLGAFPRWRGPKETPDAFLYR